MILFLFFIALNKFWCLPGKTQECDLTDTDQYFYSNKKQQKRSETHCSVILEQDLVGGQEKYPGSSNLDWAKMDFSLYFQKSKNCYFSNWSKMGSLT